MKYKLLLPAPMRRAGWDILAARKDVEAIAYEVNIAPERFHVLLRDAHGVALSLTPFGAAELAAAPALRVVARHGVGYDAVDVDALTRGGIPLMVTGIANSPSVAEQALYMMLELARRGGSFDAMVKADRWNDRLGELPLDLFEKSLLVIGFGRTGTRVARMALALEMKVSVYDPYVGSAQMQAAGCARADELDAALAGADFVSIHCPRTPETMGMFGAARLARMKRSAYLVNTARGGIIDEKALHAALAGGALAGAGLDVFDREPPAADNPLLRLPNVISAPHMAGVTREAFDRMAIATAQNLLDVLDGRPRRDHVVNAQVLDAPLRKSVA